MMAKYSQRAGEKVETTMKEMKQGKLRSGSGQKVTNPKQAIAIGLSEAREEGAKVPRKTAKKPSPKKAGSKKSAPKKVAKKSAPKKAPAKKAAPKKAAGKKTAPKKSAAKKSAPKKAARKR
ncbi:MAG: histone H1-like protein [Chitinophagaceae bacterium]|nr:MAG: histone H1-like protein [Chitinophagaceae bacterium]